MKLTLNNFFDRLIFNPFAATKTCDKATALLASIALLVLTFTACHIACAIRKCCWTHKSKIDQRTPTETKTDLQAQETILGKNTLSEELQGTSLSLSDASGEDLTEQSHKSDFRNTDGKFVFDSDNNEWEVIPLSDSDYSDSDLDDDVTSF